MKVSFIIPVYNTEPFKLNRCFESIKYSGIVDYEVVVINDGSTKGETVSFCQQYCSDDNDRYHLFSYENAGVSVARNRGIENAHGDYIYFVDADDQLMSVDFDLEKYSAMDIILTDIIISENDADTLHKFSIQGELNKYQFTRDILRDNYLWGPYSKFIKRDFLLKNRILFRDDIINGEDAVFNMHMMQKAQGIYHIPVATYIYWKEASTSSGRIQNKTAAIVNSYVTMQEEIYNSICLLDTSPQCKNYLIKLSANRFAINFISCMYAVLEGKTTIENIDLFVSESVDRLASVKLEFSNFQKYMIAKAKCSKRSCLKNSIMLLKIYQKILMLKRC